MNLAMKACPRLLWQVIVAVDERRPEKNPLDSLVDVKLLIGMVWRCHCVSAGIFVRMGIVANLNMRLI